MEKIVQNEETVENVIDIDDFFCQLVTKKEEKSLNIDRKTNCTILAFITARNRIRLHRQMIQLQNAGCTLFYCDTDSILFTTLKGEPIPLPISPAIGDFKYEIPETSSILSFDAYGRKNFELSIDHSQGKIEKITKVCGMTISPKFVQDELKHRSKICPIQVKQLRNRFTKEDGIHKATISKFTLKKTRNCERRVKTNTPCLETVPWGCP